MKMDYKITKKFIETNQNIGNPYDENTKSWHIWIDLCTSQIVIKPIIVDIDRMLDHHDLEWEYYIDDIQQLVDDGYLNIIYS